MLGTGIEKSCLGQYFLPARTEFWLSSSDNLVSQNLACGLICVFFSWHLKVWINGCGKSVAVAVAVLILIISYSIRAPGGSTTDWETDRRAGRHTAGWIIRGGGSWETLNSVVWEITKSQSDNQLLSLCSSLFDIKNDFPYGKLFDLMICLPDNCTLVKSWSQTYRIYVPYKLTWYRTATIFACLTSAGTSCYQCLHCLSVMQCNFCYKGLPNDIFGIILSIML